MKEATPIEEYIIRYLQGDICDKELHELMNWIRSSEENRALFFEIKHIHDSSPKNREILLTDPSMSWERMFTRIQPELNQQKPSFSSRKIWQRTIQYVAIVSVAMVSGWYVGMQSTLLSPEKEESPLAYTEILVEKGGKANKITLPDGSLVVLNAASRFSYPVHFNQSERSVYLDGEAYFQIAGDSLKPFQVRSGKQTIHVLGTTFNVRSYQEEPYSITTLVSGSIGLETFNEQDERVSHMLLKPNQEAISDHQSGAVSLRTVDPAFACAWMKGEYKFRDEPLATIIRKLENYYGVTIHLKDENLKRILYTGTFSLDQDIQELLRIINYDERFHFKRTGNEIFIYPR